VSSTPGPHAIERVAARPAIWRRDRLVDAGGDLGGAAAGAPGVEEITIDALEFCRTLSGRATGGGLMTQEVPF
jgi:hypothetical protein